MQDWKYAGLIKQSAEFHFGISIYSTSEFLDHWSFLYFLASLLILWAIVCFLPIYLGEKVQFININKTPNFCLKTLISEIRWFLWHFFYYIVIFRLPIFTFEQVRISVYLPLGQVDWKINVYPGLHFSFNLMQTTLQNR